MKKTIPFFMFLLVTFWVKAQNYYVSFTATGASNIVEHVDIQNLTQNTLLTINGSDILHLTNVVSVDDYENVSPFLKIFNNPTVQNCYIEISIFQNTPLRVYLFDLSGKLVLSYTQQMEKGIQQLNILDVQEGFYILEVKTPYFSQSKKLISFNKSGSNPRIEPSNGFPLTVEKDFDKGTNATVDMQYNEGDILKITGRTGAHSYVYMLDPTLTTTVTFEYVACMDGDNNHYPIVKIGNQIWMGKNLATTHFINGTTIDEVTDSLQWINSVTAAYCYYQNNPQFEPVYGILYNWYAASNVNICPLGWHVPTDLEWTELYDAIGGYYEAGRLIATEVGLWEILNMYTTNSTGFTAIPSGFRHPEFTHMGVVYDAWSRNEFSPSEAWMRRLTSNFSFNYNVTVPKWKGSSIRCLLNE